MVSNHRKDKKTFRKIKKRLPKRKDRRTKRKIQRRTKRKLNKKGGMSEEEELLAKFKKLDFVKGNDESKIKDMYEKKVDLDSFLERLNDDIIRFLFNNLILPKKDATNSQFLDNIYDCRKKNLFSKRPYFAEGDQIDPELSSGRLKNFSNFFGEQQLAKRDLKETQNDDYYYINKTIKILLEKPNKEIETVITETKSPVVPTPKAVWKKTDPFTKYIIYRFREAVNENSKLFNHNCGSLAHLLEAEEESKGNYYNLIEAFKYIINELKNVKLSDYGLLLDFLKSDKKNDMKLKEHVLNQYYEDNKEKFWDDENVKLMEPISLSELKKKLNMDLQQIYNGNIFYRLLLQKNKGEISNIEIIKSKNIKNEIKYFINNIIDKVNGMEKSEINVHLSKIKKFLEDKNVGVPSELDAAVRVT